MKKKKRERVCEEKREGKEREGEEREVKKRKKTFNFSLTSIVSKCVTAKAVGCTIFFLKRNKKVFHKI